MLKDSNAIAVLAVKDMQKAKQFYEETLGLEKTDENPGGATYKSGNTLVFVYPSEFAGTNKATAITWEVKDVEKTVEELKSKGVVFEHYDNLPETTREGDIHHMGKYKGAWFKDPDGNILNIGNEWS